MSIKAHIFQPAKAIELAIGTLFTIEEQWFVRGELQNDHRQLLESAIPITPGAEYFHLGAEPCLALASPYRFECRVIGPIRGPGLPLPASLTWTVDGEVVYTEPQSQQFMSFAGRQSVGVNTRNAFFASHWGVWVLDAAGNEVSRDPLFVIGAEA
ncbi:hypothetical protein JH288_21795 (plasmid) [Xanthomonas campestris pv. campestris]|uniref:hypothetical protein n=1 Tax=Xanthomonas campestris TaxID=339 RepID=UPI002379AD4F|nr:hypothetical protein [Xanthomonas campestris]WDL40475.1 hypothetical protein JH288_21795 [Xanthomonas campestris pv. campestris]